MSSDDIFVWNFEGGELTETVKVRDGSRGREIDILHTDGSVGNAVCRGNCPLSSDCVHFWEIKPDAEVYGSFAVIGIATSNFDVESAARNYFCGLGRDQDGESWGYNYRGDWLHKGKEMGCLNRVTSSHSKKRKKNSLSKRCHSETERTVIDGIVEGYNFADQLDGIVDFYNNNPRNSNNPKHPSWRSGSTIGVLLDRWKGTLEFYLNREPLGIAFRGIPRDAVIYPAISSTASRGGFKLVSAKSFCTSLAFECIKMACTLEQEDRLNFLERLSCYPGLKATVSKNFSFLADQRHLYRLEKTIQGEIVPSIVESSTDEEQEEVEILTPEGGFKSAVEQRTRASEAIYDGSSSDSDYDLFRGDNDIASAEGEKRKSRWRVTPKTKSRGANSDSSDSSDFFEPNSPTVTKRLSNTTATTKWTVTPVAGRKKFRLGSHNN